MDPLTNTALLVASGDVQLFVEVHVGDGVSGVPVLLLSEAEAPSSRWPEALIDGLVRLGHPVIRFDTRDVGRSTWLDEPYDLAALVADALAVLDHFAVRDHGLAVVEASDRFHELASIDTPTMVVHGTADPVYPVGHGQGLAGQLGAAELHLIEGLGHELPERFIAPLLDLFVALMQRSVA